MTRIISSIFAFSLGVVIVPVIICGTRSKNIPDVGFITPRTERQAVVLLMTTCIKTIAIRPQTAYQMAATPSMLLSMKTRVLVDEVRQCIHSSSVCLRTAHFLPVAERWQPQKHNPYWPRDIPHARCMF